MSSCNRRSELSILSTPTDLREIIISRCPMFNPRKTRPQNHNCKNHHLDMGPNHMALWMISPESLVNGCLQVALLRTWLRLRPATPKAATPSPAGPAAATGAPNALALEVELEAGAAGSAGSAGGQGETKTMLVRKRPCN